MDTNILDLKFKSGDLNREVTIREFFYELMKTLWEEGEGFSGKRPFGNSGWDADLITCLIKNKIMDGEIDEDGYIKKCNWNESNKFILEKVIKPLFNQQ